MMKPISVWKQELSGGAHAARLAALYCCAPGQTPAQAARYEAVLDGLEATFGPHAEAGLYSPASAWGPNVASSPSSTASYRAACAGVCPGAQQ